MYNTQSQVSYYNTKCFILNRCNPLFNTYGLIWFCLYAGVFLEFTVSLSNCRHMIWIYENLWSYDFNFPGYFQILWGGNRDPEFIHFRILPSLFSHLSPPSSLSPWNCKFYPNWGLFCTKYGIELLMSWGNFVPVSVSAFIRHKLPTIKWAP